jgi:hypothetical protein
MWAFELPPEHEDRLRPLGEPVAVFRAGLGNLIALWLLTIGAFVLGLGLLVGLIVAAVLLGGRGAAQAWWGGIKVGILGLVLLGGGIEGVRRIRKTRGVRIFTFTDGLARVQGDSVEVFRWQDIVTVLRASLTSSERKRMVEPSRKLILTAADGKEMELDDSLSDLRQLRELVERSTLPHLFPPVLDICEAGSDFAFGDVRVNREGLTHGGSHLPWGLCESVEVSKGVLIVKKQGAWLAFCKVPISKVHNVHVLIAFAEYVRKYPV